MQAVPLTGDTGGFWFFDAANTELIVKVLDARSLHAGYWVFYGALSDVEYTVTVTDTQTGQTKTYQNPAGTLASVADTATFASSVEMPAADSVRAVTSAILQGSLAAPESSSPCPAGSDHLCLEQSRFQIQVDWTAESNGSGHGTAVPLSHDSGYFWFFDRSNVELIVKVLDGRGVNGHFWVFYGALSNVQYTITVTDSQTNVVRTYQNAQGNLASVADTSAF